MTRTAVCVLGSANLDLVARAARHPKPGETVLGTSFAEHAGGKGLNQAVASARSGARTAFIGALGNDAAGEALAGVLDIDNIDHDLVTNVDTPTGRAIIVVDDNGENSIVVVPGANALVGAPTLPDCDVVLAQLEIPVAAVETAFASARSQTALTVLNPAPALELADELIALCDVIVPNEHEVRLLGGARRLLDAGCGAVVVTLGSAGATIITQDAQLSVPAFDVTPIDTTGAGDAFCGSLAARLSAGDALDRAVRWAAAAGALATTVAGAVPGQPYAEQIRELLEV